MQNGLRTPNPSEILIKSQSRRADQNTDANEDQAGPKSSFRSTVFQSMSKMKGFDNAEEVKQIKIIAKAAVQADQNYNRQKLVAEIAQQAAEAQKEERRERLKKHDRSHRQLREIDKFSLEMQADEEAFRTTYKDWREDLVKAVRMLVVFSWL